MNDACLHCLLHDALDEFEASANEEDLTVAKVGYAIGQFLAEVTDSLSEAGEIEAFVLGFNMARLTNQPRVTSH